MIQATQCTYKQSLRPLQKVQIFAQFNNGANTWINAKDFAHFNNRANTRIDAKDITLPSASIMGAAMGFKYMWGISNVCERIG